MSKILMENLVALMFWPHNNIFPKVFSASEIPELEIDLEKRTWMFKCGVQQSQHHKNIGSSNYFMQQSGFGVIGVYDRTNNEHLSQMNRDWHETQERKNRRWDEVD